MNMEPHKESLGSEEEFGARLQQLERKQQQEMEGQQRKMQEMEERFAKMEEFLSKVVERVLPKVEELLIRHSPPPNNDRNSPSPTGKRNNGSLELGQEFGSRLQLLEQKNMEEKRWQKEMEEELNRKQQEVEELKRKHQQMEEFLSNVVGGVMPKMEELLALHSTPPTAAPQAEKGATIFAPTSHSTQTPGNLSSITSSVNTPANIIAATHYSITTPSSRLFTTDPATRPSITSPATRPTTTTTTTTHPATRPSITNLATRPTTTTTTTAHPATPPSITTPSSRPTTTTTTTTTHPATRPSITTPALSANPTRSLLEAVEMGDAQFVRQMLANIKGRGRMISEELEICLTVAGNGDVVRALLGDARLPLDEDLGKRAVNEAASNGRVSALEALLQGGLKSPTALRCAADKGHADCVEILLRAGCDPNIKTTGGTALHFAARNGDEVCVQLLLDAGADVRATHMFDGWTPLHSAADIGATQCARLLVDAGADVNASSSHGTPLRMSQINRHEEMSRLLRERGGRR